jgi:hypothetical protein
MKQSQNERHTPEQRHRAQLIRRKMITKKVESVHIYKRKQRTQKHED